MSFFDSIWFWAARGIGEFLSALLFVFWLAIIIIGCAFIYVAYVKVCNACKRIASHCKFGR